MNPAALPQEDDTTSDRPIQQGRRQHVPAAHPWRKRVRNAGEDLIPSKDPFGISPPAAGARGNNAEGELFHVDVLRIRI